MKNPSAVIVFAVPGGIAQLVERLVRNEKVRGSNPLTSTPISQGETQMTPAGMRIYSTGGARSAGVISEALEPEPMQSIE